MGGWEGAPNFGWDFAGRSKRPADTRARPKPTNYGYCHCSLLRIFTDKVHKNRSRRTKSKKHFVLLGRSPVTYSENKFEELSLKS